MLKNYFKTALRSLWKHKFYSFINLFGLATGIACCLLIMSYVRTEMSYDQHHEHAEEVYRVSVNTQTQDDMTQYPISAYAWADIWVEEIPQITDVVRVFKNRNAKTFLQLGDRRFEEENFAFADSTFPDIFTVETIAGNMETALDEPNSVVMTEEMARKYFGSNNALGEIIKMDAGGNLIDLKVSGVIKSMPVTSHFHFDFIASLSTFIGFVGKDAPFLKNKAATAFYTYIRATDPEAVQLQLDKLYENNTSDGEKQFLKGFFLQPLTDIHLTSNLIAEIEANSNILYIYVFIFVAILTLIIACINFMNLSTARSANRSKEVGLRKVVGALRGDLVKQFIGESTIVALMSIILAVIIAEFLTPVINNSAGVDMRIDYFGDPAIILGLIGIAIFVGLIAGAYPAFFLSRFRPIQVLRGSLRSGAKNSAFRKVLVVFQFAISTAMIIGSGILYAQLNFIQTMDLGYERDWRVVIPVQLNNQNDKRTQIVERLKKAYSDDPNVISVAATSTIPGQPRQINQIRIDGRPQEESYRPVTLGVDFNYVDAMGIRIVDGRKLDASYGQDSTQSFLINEAAAKEFQLENPVGTQLIYPSVQLGGQAGNEQRGTIVGVFKDMHFEPIYRNIYPMIFRILPNQYNNIIVHIKEDKKAEAMASLEKTWGEMVPSRDFQYTFLDQELDKIYAAENRLGQLVGFFTVLAVFIACLGLFGLSAFTTEQRTKEISIRKVLGASVSDIVFLLSREFLLLVLLAFPFAAILAWLSTREWLSNFAYQTDTGVGLYLIAGVAALLIAFLTISYLSMKAAQANPANALHRD